MDQYNLDVDVTRVELSIPMDVQGQEQDYSWEIGRQNIESERFMVSDQCEIMVSDQCEIMTG